MVEISIGILIGLCICILLYKFIVVKHVTHSIRHELQLKMDADLESRLKTSKAVNVGMSAEQLAPYFPDFPYDPKDCKFLGSPVDYIVFDGLNSGTLQGIHILEVKTGNAQLSPRERQIRNYLTDNKISFTLYRPMKEQNVKTGREPAGEMDEKSIEAGKGKRRRTRNKS